MSDAGQVITDEMLKNLEKRLAKEYEQAYKDISKKVDRYFEQFEKKDRAMLEKLESGEITKERYQQWRYGQMMTGKRWQMMQEEIARDYVAVDKKAVAIVNDFKLDVYAENYNYAVYQVEHDAQMSASFTLYNKELVRQLVQDDPYIMPKKDLDVRKDATYARQKINSAVAQGIIQGESIPNITKRLMNTTQMMYNSAVRTARTATTSAQNKGRLDAYHSLSQKGIRMQKQWIATLDGRTRHSHRDLDGEIVNEDDEFSNHLMYPADPMGAPEEVYNCRCSMKAIVEGINDNRADWRKDADIQGMSYEEWKAGHADYEYPRDGVTSGMDVQEIVQRPYNEPEFMKQYNMQEKQLTTDEILKVVNPNYEEIGGKEWTYNCQRCVVTEEALYRGYDVTALGYNSRDSIKASGTACWHFSKKDWWKSDDVVSVEKRGQLLDSIYKKMDEWGDGSRAVVRVQWATKYGGNGHFLSVINDGGNIRFKDPQNGTYVDMGEKIKKMSIGRYTAWFMRVDNREFTESVGLAFRNR